MHGSDSNFFIHTMYLVEQLCPFSQMSEIENQNIKHISFHEEEYL